MLGNVVKSCCDYVKNCFIDDSVISSITKSWHKQEEMTLADRDVSLHTGSGSSDTETMSTSIKGTIATL